MTILAGVIGDPIGHSRSPRLHGHWLARYGINGHYVPLRIIPEDLDTALGLLPRLGFSGINVTQPHKEAVFARAAEVTERARAVGAANTLTFRADGGFVADTTDGAGFLASLRQEAPCWDRSRPVLVIGAGGAAAGIVAALREAGISSIAIANRTQERAETLAARFGVAAIPWAALPAVMEGAGLLVNATSLGMTGHPPLDLDPAPLPPDAIVADIVYAPLVTPLMASARARGLTIVGGLGMLLHQAVPGFAAWFGREPEVDEALRRAVLG